jgi:hypothetical protein
LILAAAILISIPAYAADLTGVPRVVDGDTLWAQQPVPVIEFVRPTRIEDAEHLVAAAPETMTHEVRAAQYVSLVFR